MAEPYPGPPLQDEHSVRLLHLSPGHWADKIECSLGAVSLETQPDYTAISYTWGSSKQEAKICVNGQPGFPVTDNVYAMLRRLRDRDQVRTLWVDSICINQKDLPERAQQVKIMGQVYSSANRTLVWLGDTGTTLSDDEYRKEVGREYSSIIEDELDQAISSTSPWWWDRAWVLQELVLSSKVDVCFGMFQKPWGDFCWDHLKVDSPTERTSKSSTYFFSSTHLSLSPVRKHMRERFESMDALRTRINSYGHLPFWDVLRYTIESDSTDRRDKVYSILSIVGREVASLVKPDYEMPDEEVFARATFAAIAAEQQFDPLYQLDLTRSQETRLPSWAVDFTHGHLFDFGNVLRLDQEVKAQWTTQETNRPFVRISKDSKHLIVSGVCLDEIGGINPITTMLYENRAHPVRIALVSTLQQLQTSHGGYEGIISYKCPTSSIRPHEKTAPFSNAISAFASSSSSVQQLFRSAIALWSKILQVPQNNWGDLIYENGLFIFWQYAKSFPEGSKTDEAEETAAKFRTNSAFFGIAPSGIQVGDFVVLVRGSRFPMVLRPVGTMYRFCGFAFVYGVMNGELLVMCDETLFEEREFTLV